MNKIVVLCCLLAVSTAGFLGFNLHQRQQALTRLSSEVNSLKSLLATNQTDLQTKSAANMGLEAKVNELSAVVAQSKTELASAKQRIKEIDEASDVEKAAKQAKEQELRQAMVQVPPPTVITSKNSAGGEVKTLVFEKLLGRNGQVLASHAEFLSVDGRKVFFKYGSGGGSLDVDALHLGVLAHLGIDPDAAKQLQVRLDVQRAAEDNLRIQAATARIAFYEKLKNDRREADAKVAAQKATEQAAQAEADRQRKQADNERMQAEAAKKQADAAMISAQRPDYYYYNPFLSGVAPRTQQNSTRQ